MKDHELLTARFTNNERTTVNSLWVSNEDGTIHEMNIIVEEGDYWWEDLQDHIDIDTLQENTYQWIQSSQEEFQNTVIAVGKENGWIYNLDDLDTEVYKAVVKSIFLDDFDPHIHKEQLFFLKMELFETEMIKQATDRELKKELRKAPDLISCIEAACRIFRASQVSASTDTPD